MFPSAPAGGVHLVNLDSCQLSTLVSSSLWGEGCATLCISMHDFNSGLALQENV